MSTRPLLPLLGILAVSACPSEPPPVIGTVPVAVNVECTGPDVVFTVRPWHLELAEGAEVRWDLAADGQTLQITKRQSAWPFNTNKFTGNRADPATSRGMKGGQAGKTFRYSIAVTCQVDGAPRTVVLDPDMYIKK